MKEPCDAFTVVHKIIVYRVAAVVESHQLSASTLYLYPVIMSTWTSKCSKHWSDNVVSTPMAQSFNLEKPLVNKKPFPQSFNHIFFVFV